MSIKYLNPKSYGQVYQRLVNGYRKVKGKDPTGLDLIKIKLEAAEQIRNSEKIIKFPEEKITPFYEGRPSKGPQADVKKFPTKNKPAAQTYSSDFLDLLEEFNKISKNQPSLAEITGVSNKYPEKTGIVKSTIELLESKDPKSLSRELQRIMKREGTYVDYSDEEVAQILNGFESRTKNKIKPAEEMIDKGDFDPSGFAGGGLAYMLGEPVRMFKGGRIGYSVGAGKKGVQGLLDLVKNKFGKKSITTADKVARPESAITRDLFKRMSKKLKNKLPKKGEFIEDGETPDYEYYAELLNDAEDSRGFNVQGDETIEVLEDRLKQLKDEEAYYYGQYKAGKLDPEPGEINRSRLTFLKNKSEEAEMSRDKRLITQDELEELDSLEKRFEYLDLEEKAQDVNRKLTNSEIERLKEINDSGYVDFQKEIDKINRNKKAYGGRIGYSGGGIVKFLNKVLGKQHLSEIKKTDPQLYKGLLEVAPLFKKRDKEALIKYMQKYLPERSADEIEELVTGPNDKMYGQLIRLGSGRDYKGKQELFKKIDQKEMLENLDVKGRKANAVGGRIGYTNGGITKTKADYEKELETKDDYEKEDNKILDILDLQVQGAMSGKQQIEGAPPGITSDLKTLEIIANFDIPLDDKINLYANYQRNKSRNRIEKADQEVYLGEGAYRNREVGLNYNKDGEGFSADAKYNMDSEEPEFRFKYKKLFGGPKKRAKGGRIGFAAGGIDKVRRAFLKLLGAGAGATAATKTGLFGLLKGKQEAKIATKAAEQVVKRNEPPAYVFDLVEIIRAKGKDITKSAQTIERETVKTYKGVDLYETPDGFRIRAEGKSAQEGGKEIDLMYSQMDEIKDEGLETQKSFTVTDYEEATVRPDAEGKMKDVDFYVDEADHKELKKIVDEEKNKFKSGGLAYMLGE
jgi:hypothetical protein